MRNLPADRVLTTRAQKSTAESRLIARLGTFGFMSRDSMRLPQNRRLNGQTSSSLTG
jgi:hypothetical protein